MNRHSVLYGNDPQDCAKQAVRGQRGFCSNRGQRGGCGRTFALFLADILPRHTVRANLPPLLSKRQFALVERAAGNLELAAYPGLIVKDSYWRWPQRNQAGNTIDFFVQVLGLSFHHAMREITGK